MAKEKQVQQKVKKGAVISRRNNRTINQDIAHRDPKWEDVGNGTLKLKGSHNHIQRGKDNRWESVRKQAA